MSLGLLIVVAVVTLVVVSVFARRLGVAAPIVLVLVGIGMSLLPNATVPHIAPDIILEIVLPPLLYSAAVKVPVVDLRRNLRAISMLSVFLVIGSAFAVAVVLWALLPRLDFAAALAVGAVVSPTDAVAATAVAKRLGLPARLVTLLEGESLVNDASALVLLKVALGASSAAITFGHVTGQLAYAIAVSVALGVLVGFVSVRFRSRLKDPVLDSVVSFAVPFVAYLVVERLGASGVLAVVVAGIYSGHFGAKRISARARLTERINWSTAQFVLENGVFLLMGLQLRQLVEKESDGSSVGVGLAWAVELGLLVAAVLLVVRMMFVAFVIWGQRNQQKDVDRMGERLVQMIRWMQTLPEQFTATERGRRRANVAHQRIRMRQGDVKDLQRDPLDWRAAAVASWAGMRGVVTLAAAQSLPDDGSIPYRSALILVAFVVALATLLIQGSTLPAVIRLSRVPGNDKAADDRELAGLMDELYRVAENVLENPQLPSGEQAAPEAVEQLRTNLAGVRGRAWERVERNTGETDGPGRHQQYRLLLAEVLDEQREALLEARAAGQYASRVLERAQAVLDSEETRLEPLEGE